MRRETELLPSRAGALMLGARYSDSCWPRSVSMARCSNANPSACVIGFVSMAAVESKRPRISLIDLHIWTANRRSELRIADW